MTVGNFVGDVFTNLVANLVASGITTIGLQTFQGARKVLSEAEILKKRNRINLIVRTGISNSIPTLKSDDDVLVERIYQFLLSPAAESIVRQIYSSHITNNHLSITSIRQEFLLGLTLYTGYHVDQVVDVADSIFDILQRGCEHALEEAIDKGVLLAHEARSVQRFRMLQDELDSIQKNLAFLIDQKRINVQEILKYEQEYRQQVTNRHGYIIPADLDGRQKIPIDELYVTPRFIIDSDTNTQEPII